MTTPDPVTVAAAITRRRLAEADQPEFLRRQCRKTDGNPKPQYDSEEQADRYASKINATPDQPMQPNHRAHSYMCANCGFWHVGRYPVRGQVRGQAA